MSISLTRAVISAATSILILSTGLARAEPFGQPVGGWNITQELRGKQLQCRATLKEGKMLHVLGTNVATGKSFVTELGQPLAKGKYPHSTIVLANENFDVTVISDGKWLYFYLEDFDLEKLAIDGAYVLNIPLPNGNFAGGEITLNKSTLKALDAVSECVNANKG